MRPSHYSRLVISNPVSLVPILVGRIDYICLLPHAVVIMCVVIAVPLNQAHDIGERLEVLIESLPGAQVMHSDYFRPGPIPNLI